MGGVNAGASARWLRGLRVAGACERPACACERRAVCGGAGWGTAGGQRDSETFERRQTLPLSTLTPTISQKKAVNPLLAGQARGKVSAGSQLPSLPQLMPFGQVNSFIATGPLLRPPAFAGGFPKAPRVSFLPGGLPDARGASLGFGSVCAGGEGGRGQDGSRAERRGRWPHSCSVGKREARRPREGEADPKPVPPRRGPPRTPAAVPGGGRSPLPAEVRVGWQAGGQAAAKRFP